MTTGTIVAIVIAALIVIALLALLARAGRNRRLESRRTEASHRNLHPTEIEKDYEPLAAPDLSRAWN